MSEDRRGRLVVLSGPSCMGKTPLARALARFFPDRWRALEPVVLCNSRPPRPGETDGVEHRFRSRGQIEGLRGDDRYVVVDVRGDLQALDAEQLVRQLQSKDAFYEGNPYVAHTLLTDPRFQRFDRLGIFLSPLSKQEILFLRDQPAVSLRSLVTDIMRRKLQRRATLQQAAGLSPDPNDIQRRAARAYEELRTAYRFDYVVPNHDGEDSEHWEAFGYPLGDARRTLLAVADLLAGATPEVAETWEADLLPE